MPGQAPPLGPPATRRKAYMRWKTLSFAVFFVLWGLPRPAAAVDLALVLLNDVSRSMDAGEYALVKDGYRAAFSDPEVVAALVGNGGGLAGAYVGVSRKAEFSLVLDWQLRPDADPP